MPQSPCEERISWGDGSRITPPRLEHSPSVRRVFIFTSSPTVQCQAQTRFSIAQKRPSAT
ncbi:hypothetical protein VFPBJ_10021 [Purpureocillium lilacinum]|uniref:Uncharacterized protein n=1 Tax=Purpureocillium lilacinum TaxID=33203 RepID=A0A179GA82_PURLI|nr:hypothetical protein VFPBJ_10021 [Purpureocillium lilacinum]